MKILFVCLGNICRSAAAEAVFQQKAEERGLPDVVVDSAGILSIHKGQNADSRMIAHAAKRGYAITSKSRPVTKEDFRNFDMLIGMDSDNIAELQKRATNREEYAKIVKMTDFASHAECDNVPDPYYGGAEGFEKVLDILEDSCEGLLDALTNKEIIYE